MAWKQGIQTIGKKKKTDNGGKVKWQETALVPQGEWSHHNKESRAGMGRLGFWISALDLLNALNKSDFHLAAPLYKEDLGLAKFWIFTLLYLGILTVGPSKKYLTRDVQWWQEASFLCCLRKVGGCMQMSRSSSLCTVHFHLKSTH